MIQYILKNNGRKDLRSFGPRMPISLCIPSRTANRAIGNEIGALIDTGASRSAVSPTVAVRMGLQQIGIQKVSLAGRSEVVPTYAAAIYFPRQKFTDIQLIELLGLTLPDQPVECLIGRDILSRWLLSYDGRSGECRMEEEDSPLLMIQPEV